MIDLSPENKDWVDGFRAEFGRSPRVLHIGNIANNAYNNAKLLIEAGLDNDVLCYDYYHTMGCPEWEDADFLGTVSNDFKPCWSDLDLKGFKRPGWFVQGPQKLCIDYLLARQTGEIKSANRFWRLLKISNGTSKAFGFWSRLNELRATIALKAFMFPRRIYRLSRFDPVLVFTSIYEVTPKGGVVLRTTLTSLLMLVWAFLRLCSSARNKMKTMLGARSLDSAASGGIDRYSERTRMLLEAWQSEFPDRSDQLTANDLVIYRSSIKRWRQLFSYYDFVIGYSTDGIFPLLAEKAYFAFEHGTIREIPYQATAQGRNAAITYRNAEHVFVTNFDCLASAKKLAAGRFTLINHPYDEDHGLGVSGWQELRDRLRSNLDCDLVCFFPTRHDWVPGTGYADKSNDVFLLALAELRHAGLRVGAVCCDWGANVEQSKSLIANAGLEPHIRWERPMAMVQFERMARACDLVVDQFKLGAFGGIVFKAMAVGAPILTYLDEDRLLEQYPEMPPVINCATQVSIFEKLGPLVAAPGNLVKLGEASRAWIKKYHAKQGTINLQLDQFRKMTMKHAIATV